MAEPLLSIDGLIKRFGGLIATDNLSLDVRHGEIHALIGPNGAGKTTLVAQLMGQLPSDAGRILFAGADISRLPTHRRVASGLARSFQITSVLRDFTALDNVALAVQAHQGHSFRFWRPAQSDPALRDPARAILEQLGLADRAQTLAANLSYGEQRLLLLAEPMAGMGPDESARMVAFLQRLKGRISMLLIEHDMDAVFALADRITVLVYGRAIATGTPDEIRANAEVRRAYLGEEHADA